MATADGVLDRPNLRTSTPSPIARRTSRCVVCGETSQKVVLREGVYSGHRCSCGTVYTSPLPAEGEIDFTHDAHPDEFYSCSADYKARWLARACPPGRLLEVGCGNGSFLVAARQRGFDVSGLELHAGRAASVVRRHGIEVRSEFLDETTWPRGSFDVVYHCDMLSHFRDPVGSLQAMTDLLRPNGQLCFEAGLLGGISAVWYRLLRRVGLEHHLWLYSESSLRRLLESAGLEVVQSQHFGLLPYIGVGRAAALARKLISGSLNATRTQLGSRAARSVDAAYYQFRHWLRYPVGALSPKIGPQTVLLVARPVAC